MKTDFEGVRIESPYYKDTEVLHRAEIKEIRSWSFVLIILGVIHIFTSGFLSAPWGILLIFVGLASFYFRSSAMLVIYAVTIVWAGISNLTSRQDTWMIFAIIQWVIAFRIFRRFHDYRQGETILDKEETNSSGLTPERSAKVFPWAGFILGVVSLISFISLIVGIIIYTIIYKAKALPEFWGFVEGLIVNFGVLGFAMGLASVLCGYKRKPIAILGMITGILTLIVEIILGFI
jgi:hypothetical protein